MANDKPKRPRKKDTCAVKAYARAVVSGKIVAGKLVKLACKRHLNDLKSAKERGLVWDTDAARHAISFFGHLRHSTGEWANQPFDLLPWQAFVIGSLYGWKRAADGLRRYRTAYVEVARKNGKSVMLAGTALYALVADGELGAHVYAAATTRDQARIIFGEAERMVDASPPLRARITRTVNNLAVLLTSSWFRPLSADATKMDGLNVHFAAVDEVHEHPNPDIIQKLNTATGARREPLIFEITTAGYNRQSVCRQHHEFSVKVLEGTVPPEASDSWFAYIATIDPSDDWTNPDVWIKANPSLGVTVKIDDLKRQVDEAREMPAQQNAIRRLRLNEWTEQVTRWIDMAVWADGADVVNEDELIGRPCYGGLDLARVNDLSSLALVFPPEQPGENVKVIWRHWCPAEDILRRARRDRAPYPTWRDQGHLTATEGNTTDFKFIEAEILSLSTKFNLLEVAYDRTFAGELVRNLQDEGVNMVEFGQGFISMGPAAAEFMRLLIARALKHGGNPVATWCASNVSVRRDPAGNEKPDKEKSTERIDAIVAAIMAVGRLQTAEGGSVYEERGLLMV
ncbi:MAG: terminase large subunit [Alphaproteobacteria bacterium]|nr:terminase large subunit [Alphaproteobacteria bacterium]